MSRPRFVAALAEGALLVATGELAARATPVHDGTYLGYVRTLPGAGSMVAVDLVSRRDGERPGEIRVDAGALAHVDILTERPRPFRLVIHDGTIVQVATADDVLGG
jgi:hypothetical protein